MDQWLANNLCLVHVSSIKNYHQTTNINRNLVGNKRVDHPDVVEASPVYIRAKSYQAIEISWLLANTPIHQK